MTFRKLRVPASSANLGPAFDALALALGVYLECRFRPADQLAIHVAGRDAASISSGEDNLIWQTALRIAGDMKRTMPPIELHITNGIPLGKGLGSSAAALTAGVVIADAMLSLRWSRGRVLDEAARIEGHPDNVAACVHGSIVASATDARDVTHAARLELHPRFGIAVVVPDFLLPTVEARRVLPKTYSRADVIFNIQRSALLVTALATGITDAFPTALEDRLHQPYRAALVPGLDEIIGLRMKGLLGCALSGAGPSILVFYQRGYEHVCQSVQHVFTAHGKDSEVMLTELATTGYELS
ncbi:MAG TPA: homoserine kinase [Bryobacteraceae bacterium]|nr:homoserine kinase [Bryobacteraceae bacterium]